MNARADIRFRRLRRDDFVLLARWLAAPEAVRWWNHEYSHAALERDFGPGVDGVEPGEDLLCEFDGVPVGLVQRCRLLDHPEYVDELGPVIGAVCPGDWSIDYLLGPPDLLGRGLGPRMIEAVCADTFDTHATCARIVVPVVSSNRRSWRALEKAGFAIIAHGRLTPDNPTDDPAHHVLALDRPTR